MRRFFFITATVFSSLFFSIYFASNVSAASNVDYLTQANKPSISKNPDQNSAKNIKDTHLQKWPSFFETTLKSGDNRNLAMGDFFFNLKEKSDSLLFLDLRGQADDNSSNEYNLGFGYRNLFEKSIWGGYVYYDQRKSSLGNDFNQITFGLERLSDNWDLRANAYLPLTNDNFFQDSISSNSNDQLQASYSSEHALKGIDFEIGHKIPVGHTRFFVSSYYFPEEESNSFVYDSVFGQKARLESKFFCDLLTLGGELNHDNIDGTTPAVYLRFRIPFGAKAQSQLTSLERRMTDTIIRDVDVKTSQVKGTSAATITLNNVDYSNNTTLVNLDSDSDFSNTISNANSNSLIVVHGSGTTSSNISLKEGQTLIGGNSSAIVSYSVPGGGIISSSRNLNLGAATINNSDNSVVTISANVDNVTIQDLTIKGGLKAIRLDGSASNATLKNLTIQDFASDGIEINNLPSGGTVTIDNVNIDNGSSSNSEGRGIVMFGDNNSDIVISGSTISVVAAERRYAGGIYNLGSGSLTVSDSAISVYGGTGASSSSAAGEYGGNAYGIYHNPNVAANATISNVTIAVIGGNGGASTSSSADDGGAGGVAYGIRNLNGTATISGTINVVGGNGGSSLNGNGGNGGDSYGAYDDTSGGLDSSEAIITTTDSSGGVGVANGLAGSGNQTN